MLRFCIKALMLSAMLVLMASCSGMATFMDSGYFFKDYGVTVASCPTNTKFIVNGMECITPCKIDLPYDTNTITVEYNDKASIIPLTNAVKYEPNISGTLMILNPDKIGLNSDAPDSVLFLRDSTMAAQNICGADGVM